MANVNINEEPQLIPEWECLPEFDLRPWVKWAKPFLDKLRVRFEESLRLGLRQDAELSEKKALILAYENVIKSRKALSVYEIGSEVRMVDLGDTRATITEVHLTSRGTEYDVFYYAGSGRQTARVTERELESYDVLVPITWKPGDE